MAKQKRSLRITVKGKTPNTVEVSFTEATVTDDGGIKDARSTTTDDDFALGSALHETISRRVTDFIERLQEDEGPTLFTEKKAAKAGAS